jgi:hypothetical protein
MLHSSSLREGKTKRGLGKGTRRVKREDTGAKHKVYSWIFARARGLS